MLAQIVGNVDPYSAAVLVSLVVCLCIAVTTLIGKRRSRIEMANELELAKIRLENEKQMAFGKMRNDRDYKFKQLDQNLITSHRSDSDEG